VHEQFQDLLDELARLSGVGQEVLGEVLARTSLRAPDETSRVEISAGNLAARRSVDQRAIPQGTVSKAVKALRDQGLLEDGESFLRSEDGRALSPLRLGRGFAIAGVHIEQRAGRPSEVATALVGLDGSQVLGTRRTPVSTGGDAWEQAARLIHREIASLKSGRDQARDRDGLAPLRMFGIGVEVGAPVQDGKIMPLPGSPAGPPVDFANMLSALFGQADGLDRPVPVVVENDVNALAVLAIHEVHYVESDLVVVGVFDEGIGGGLVMDGRVRRGGNGRAMEIGHLTVGLPPGDESASGAGQQDQPAGHNGAATGFTAPCPCGHLGHVDALATPSRIQAELAIPALEQAGKLDPHDPAFPRAHEVFARSGAALGRALAHVSNIVNPNRLIVYMPAALAQPEANTAVAAYRAAVEREAASAFSASGQPGYLTVRPLPARPEDAALLGAKAAAICVLESFIEHALRLDGCMTTLRRPSSGTGEFKVLKALTGRAGERIAQAGVDPFHECLRAPGSRTVVSVPDSSMSNSKEWQASRERKGERADRRVRKGTPGRGIQNTGTGALTCGRSSHVGGPRDCPVRGG
jgi:predicted NBD/HSP70 family sugar kinase